jgi:hypothetical protein
LYVKPNITLENYLKLSTISIGVPCSTKLVSLLSKENINPKLLILSAEIIRIANDISSIQKDRTEHTKNITNLLKLKEVTNLLETKIVNFKKYKPLTKPDIFLSRLVRVSLNLYKSNKDFEL